jgi:pimeloyl-ACP methyl ester carboxylesterase
VDGAGIRFAYRRFGKNEGVPLVFFQHFTGTMDNWDPAVTNGLARDREVILFNNAGISSSGGETPNTIAEMARHAAAFIRCARARADRSLRLFAGRLCCPAVDSGPSQAG